MSNSQLDTQSGLGGPKRMRVVDSHTEGEPTRLILEGGPDLGTGHLSERRRIFASLYDTFRTFALNEPRGFDAMVGALLCEPFDRTCAAGLIFFNNVGFIGMCGHGTIGAAVSLAHLGQLGLGLHRFETPVGIVTVELHDRNAATVENVPSFVHRRGLRLPVEGVGVVEGDLAWGGNWFFLTEDAPCALERANIPQLTLAAQAITDALAHAQIRGADGAQVDHIEFFGPSPSGDADCRNFVLCPGGAYDRSPCGTGTSAKLACLADRGDLAPGAPWVQESIIGSRFVARYERNEEGAVVPRITGRAWVVAEATLIGDPTDPFPNGISSG
jgi:4-hydroxyproline epimerase